MEERERIAPVIRERVIRAVQQSLAEAWGDPFWSQLEEAYEDARAPLVDVQDRDDHYLVVAEMPGIPKENVDVRAKEDSVEISGDAQLACEIDHVDLAYLCNERTMTNFRRRVPLPKPVVPSKVEATMEDGVLVVKLPKVRPREDEAAVLVKVK
jgi:HSP20 family protein